jgi:hypothetical protein
MSSASSSSAATGPSPSHTNTLATLRALGRKKRGLLANGATVELRTHDGSQLVTQLPYALFTVVSEEVNLLEKFDDWYYICLPTYLIPAAIKDLVSRIVHFTNPSVDVVAMESTGILFNDLNIASAAEYLGMTSYTQRIFNQHWKRLMETLPSPADINAICKVDTPLAEKLLNVIAYNMAKLSRAGKLPNTTAFDEELIENSRFGAAVNAIFYKWDSNSEAFAAREERRKAQTQYRAKERVKYAAIKEEDAKLGQAVREKMRHAGSKYTAQEAGYIYRIFGKRVPIVAKF